MFRAHRRESHTARAALAAAGLVAVACDRLPLQPTVPASYAVRGITLTSFTPAGYETTAAANALAGIAATGANTVILVVTAYQGAGASSAVHEDPAHTPQKGSVRAAIQTARTLGLRVVLKPHVDADDATWRGLFTPADPAAWFTSYQDFVGSWAALADSAGCEGFIVGTELASTIGHEGEWRDTIRRVRAAFHGMLLYAASWDEAGRVPFWDALDLVGVDFYYPVAGRADPSRFELRAGWQPWLERLALLNQQTGRRILLTEIGYRSVDGAVLRPWDFTRVARIDLQEQADAYGAALEAVASRDWIEGLCWWDWSADGGGGPLDAGYTPRGKPAERELRSAWRP